jgi:hypothetical protein
MNFTAFDPLAASELNDIVENIEALSDGTGLDNPNFVNNGGVWWQQIGRTTLASAGDTITVSSIPARKYLLIRYLLIATGGTNNSSFIFNSDTGANYSQATADIAAGGAVGNSTSATSLALEVGSPATGSVLYGTLEIVNIAAQPKVGIYTNVHNVTAAGTAPTASLAFAKWSNTSAQISSVTFTNAGTGDYAIGSEVIILGRD